MNDTDTVSGKLLLSFFKCSKRADSSKRGFIKLEPPVRLNTKRFGWTDPRKMTQIPEEWTHTYPKMMHKHFNVLKPTDSCKYTSYFRTDRLRANTPLTNPEACSLMSTTLTDLESFLPRLSHSRGHNTGSTAPKHSCIGSTFMEIWDKGSTCTVIQKLTWNIEGSYF